LIFEETSRRLENFPKIHAKSNYCEIEAKKHAKSNHNLEIYLSKKPRVERQFQSSCAKAKFIKSVAYPSSIFLSERSKWSVGARHLSLAPWATRLLAQ